MIKKQIKESSVKSRLSEIPKPQIGILGWKGLGNNEWEISIGDYIANIKRKDNNFDLFVFIKRIIDTDKSFIDGGSFETFEAAEDWFIKNYKTAKKQDGGKASKKVEIKFSSYSPDKKIMTFTLSDFKEMLNEINRKFKERLQPITGKVARLGDIFNYGTLFPDYIVFTFNLKDINPAVDGKILEDILKKYTERVNWSQGSISLFSKTTDVGEWNVSVSLTPKLIDSQSNRILDDRRTEHKFQDEGTSIDEIIPGNIELKNGGKTEDLNDNSSNNEHFDSSNKIHTFTNKSTKDEIRNVISGASKVSNGAAIQAVASYLRRSHKTGEVAEREFDKKREKGSNPINIGTESGIEKRKYVEELENVKRLIIGGKTDDFGNLGNITKKQIQDVISGKSKISNSEAIEAASAYLRRNAGTSQKSENPDFYKRQEAEHLKKFSYQNNFWFMDKLDEDKRIDEGEGAEQRVYRIDSRNVLKLNNLTFYNSWEDYFNSLLLHNYFFPDTSYELIGFIKENNILFPVIKQQFVEETGKTNLNDVKKIMADNGFSNTRKNDYYNEKLGIILEDLHEGNVLTKDDILYFVDTVFYIKNNYLKEKDGGTFQDLSGQRIDDPEVVERNSLKLERMFAMDKFTDMLQQNINDYFQKEYPGTFNKDQHPKVSVKDGAKYIRIDIGSSGTFMLDKSNNHLYYIKGYGVIDKKKDFGNIKDIVENDFAYDGYSILSKHLADKGQRTKYGYAGQIVKDSGATVAPKMEDGGKLNFYSSCVNYPDIEDLETIIENEKEISREVFNKNVDHEERIELEKNLGYTKDFPIQKDWHVRWLKSKDKDGDTVYFIRHSATEYIFKPGGSRFKDGGTTKDKRYAVTTDMYSYAPDDKAVIKQSQEFVGDLRNRLDNQAQIIEIAEAPFGSVKTRKLENVPKYSAGGKMNGVDIKYTRVIPRDLFNESKLLKCVGRLILLIHNNQAPVGMSFDENGDPFKIGLMDEGSLTIVNLKIFIKNKEYIFKTTYNNKSNYPFYVQDDDYTDYRVFDEKGEFDNEFIEFFKTAPQYKDGGKLEKFDWENLPNLDLGIDVSKDWMKLWEKFTRENKLNLTLPHTDPKDRGEQSDNAYFMLRHIVKVKRGNWTPDWKNENQYKYYPYFWMDKTGSGFVFSLAHNVLTHSVVSSRLCFPTASLCEAVAKEFLPIYKIYFTEK